jgi:hypothetical protein
VTYEQQRERAERALRDILVTGEVGGVRSDIRRGFETRWGEPLNPGWFGIPDGSRKYVVAPATIDIDDWLRLQHGASGGDFSFGSFQRGAYGPTVEMAAESVRSGSYDIPTPVLEVDPSGEVLAQEGRSRAIGARRGGASRMPIWVAVRVYR